MKPKQRAFQIRRYQYPFDEPSVRGRLMAKHPDTQADMIKYQSAIINMMRSGYTFEEAVEVIKNGVNSEWAKAIESATGSSSAE